MKDIYTPVEQAAEILGERLEDTRIQTRVDEYLNGVLPNNCLKGQRRVAILARYVARATVEDDCFQNYAFGNGFTPYWATYVGDRFTTINSEKVDTARPPMLWPKQQTTRGWIVEPANRVGGVGTMQTKYGCDVADFWAKIRENVFGASWQTSGAIGNTFDVGDWYSYQATRFGYGEEGKKAPFYYQALMALLTCKCVMFEDYDDGQDKAGLERFREEVLYPAIEKVQADLGLSPLIVRLPYNPTFRYTAVQWVDESPGWQQAMEETTDPVKALLQTPLNTDNMESLCDL